MLPSPLYMHLGGHSLGSGFLVIKGKGGISTLFFKAWPQCLTSSMKSLLNIYGVRPILLDVNITPLKTWVHSKQRPHMCLISLWEVWELGDVIWESELGSIWVLNMSCVTLVSCWTSLSFRRLLRRLKGGGCFGSDFYGWRTQLLEKHSFPSSLLAVYVADSCFSWLHWL